MPNWRRLSVCVSALAMLSVMAPLAQGQVVNRTVGGVMIDSEGIVQAMTQTERSRLADKLRAQITASPDDLQITSTMRMISLRGLEATLRKHQARNQPLPDEVRYLAGLQRVEFVFVIPERNDIVIGGPAEGWTVGERGDIVGVETGQPVVRLDDLLVAFQAHSAAQRSNINCSIDPSAEGRVRLDAFLAKQTKFHRGVLRGIEQAMGPQVISVEGVATDSHLASVLVASDFRMKALAMDLEPAPIAGMPSFPDLMKSGKDVSRNMMPRWWMACDYDSIARSEDGLTWQLRGQGVKVMTEDELVTADGAVTGTGQVNPLAQQWSQTMNEKYTELSAREPIFGQLRNVMDLSVVAALLHTEGLLDKVGMDVNGLVTAGMQQLPEKWNVPKTVATKSSFIKKNGEYIITASGGVSIESWAAASRSKIDPSIGPRRESAVTTTGDSWRWN